MRKFEFTLVIEGDLDSDEPVEQLYEARCDDATFGSVDGVGFGDFHRRAKTFDAAVLSAIEAVESVAGLRVLHVEPDNLVTMADIAHRLGKSREYIRLLATGRKGRNFPKPISHLGGRSKLWRWSDVASWAGHLDDESKASARFIAAVNAALDLRDAALPSHDRKQLLATIGTRRAPAAK
jgi:predicted DNA-binding transcriptional regulator AlpA